MSSSYRELDMDIQDNVEKNGKIRENQVDHSSLLVRELYCYSIMPPS
jgi:hypothetical protein